MFYFIFQVFCIVSLGLSAISYFKNFKNQSYMDHFYSIALIFVLTHVLSSIKLPNTNKVNANLCQNMSQNNFLEKAFNEGIYSVHCLKKGNQRIVILGETHYKGSEDKELGKDVIDSFPSYAIEGASIKDLSPMSQIFISGVLYIAYPIVGIFFEDSTINDAAENALNNKKKIYSLESGDLSLWDKEYYNIPFLKRNVILTKRNLRMRDNLYEINKRENIVVAIVGKAHSEELADMLSQKYNYQHGSVPLN